jgi:uncharacterized repeat protein (TIGR01451 family)
MKLNFKKIALGLVLTGGFAGSALAAGTAAGTDVENLATLTFKAEPTGPDLVLESSPTGNSTVGASNGESTDFVVDRKLDFEVVTTDTTLVSVLEGDTAQVTTFTLKNTSNDTLDFALAALNRASGSMTDPYAATDSFDVTTATMSIAVGGSTQDYVDNLAPDAMVTITITSDIPDDGITVANGGVGSGDIALVTLVAQVAEDDDGSGGAATPGALIAQDSSGNAAPGGTAASVADDPDAVQDVFAEDDVEGNAGSTIAARAAVTHNFVANGSGRFDGDGAGTDVASNGQFAATSGYIIEQPELVVTKESETVWDAFSCSVATEPTDSTADVDTLCGVGTNPKAIPGAYVRYTLTIQNNGNTEVTGASIADTVDTDTLLVVGPPTSVVVEDGDEAAVDPIPTDGSSATDLSLSGITIAEKDAADGDDVIVITFFVTIK